MLCLVSLSFFTFLVHQTSVMENWYNLGWHLYSCLTLSNQISKREILAKHHSLQMESLNATSAEGKVLTSTELGVRGGAAARMTRLMLNKIHSLQVLFPCF